MNQDLKKAYQEKTEAKIKEWSAKLSELKSKTTGLNQDAKEKINPTIEQLQQKINQSKESLAQLRKLSQENWQQAKAKLEGISEGIKNAIGEIKSKM